MKKAIENKLIKCLIIFGYAWSFIGVSLFIGSVVFGLIALYQWLSV
jgi:hypothetical protein